MSKPLFIKPAKVGGVVRFPDNPGRKLSGEGEEVKRSTYWTRRLADGSVVEAKPVKTSKEAAK